MHYPAIASLVLVAGLRLAEPLEVVEQFDNLLAGACVRPLVSQAMLLRVRDEPPLPAEIDAFCGRLNDIVEGGGALTLVQIYTIARAPAEAWVSALSNDELHAIAEHVRRQTGLPVEEFPGRRANATSIPLARRRSTLPRQPGFEVGRHADSDDFNRAGPGVGSRNEEPLLQRDKGDGDRRTNRDAERHPAIAIESRGEIDRENRGGGVIDGLNRGTIRFAHVRRQTGAEQRVDDPVRGLQMLLQDVPLGRGIDPFDDDSQSFGRLGVLPRVRGQAFPVGQFEHPHVATGAHEMPGNDEPIPAVVSAAGADANPPLREIPQRDRRSPRAGVLHQDEPRQSEAFEGELIDSPGGVSGEDTGWGRRHESHFRRQGRFVRFDNILSFARSRATANRRTAAEMTRLFLETGKSDSIRPR